MKRVSIKDVAKAAGVSITTVSHALSGGGNLRPETRERVAEIAREMHYTPDWRGSNLKSSGTRNIGLFVESIRGFYGTLADTLSETLKDTKYELQVFITDKGENVIKTILSGRVDGAVILHNGISKKQEEILLDAQTPIVFLDREIVGNSVSSLLFDSYDTGYKVAEYLYKLGHRRLLLIKGLENFDGCMRKEGFEAFLKEKNMETDENYCLDGAFDQRVTYHAMNRFLEKGLPLPDAVFATNDDSAFGCIKALAEHGISVPEDVSVIGCDDIELSRWYIPALTTMRTHITDLGELAAGEILALIGEEHTGYCRKIDAELVERHSCKAR